MKFFKKRNIKTSLILSNVIILFLACIAIIFSIINIEKLKKVLKAQMKTLYLLLMKHGIYVEIFFM